MNDKPQPNKPASIPVKTLRFASPLDVPGRTGASALSVRKQDNAGTYLIEYQPQLRHHKVTYSRTGQATEVRYIHECHVQSWEPA